MNRVLSVTNHKGGVGKTTTAVNIAYAFAETGKEVLLIDLDPQGSATVHLGIRDDGSRILHAMQNAMALPVVSTGIERLALVPSGPVFADARQRFSGVLATELLSRCFSRTEGPWDIAIVDCPPSLDMLTLNALRVSSHVVIPVEANRLALRSLRQTLETIELARKDNRSIELLAIIVCRSHPRRRIHKEVMSEIEKTFPGKTAPVIRENVSLAEAPGLGLPAALHAPDSSGAADYSAVARWLRAGLFSAQDG
jgi:chromosome partitioning protein